MDIVNSSRTWALLPLFHQHLLKQFVMRMSVFAFPARPVTLWFFILHSHCNSCPDPNPGLALTPWVAYPYCACLPKKEKQQQVGTLLCSRRIIMITFNFCWTSCDLSGVVTMQCKGHLTQFPSLGFPSWVSSLIPLEDVESNSEKEARSVPTPPYLLPTALLPTGKALLRDQQTLFPLFRSPSRRGQQELWFTLLLSAKTGNIRLKGVSSLDMWVSGVEPWFWRSESWFSL